MMRFSSHRSLLLLRVVPVAVVLRTARVLFLLLFSVLSVVASNVVYAHKYVHGSVWVLVVDGL